MADDPQMLELELETQLLTKTAHLTERAELRDAYHAQRINGAVWLNRESELEHALAEIHVKISVLEARIATARAR